MPTAPPLQGDGWIRSQQALEAIHTLLNVHGGAGSFAEKTGCSSTGVMPTPAARRRGLNAVVGREVSGKSLQAVEERISPMV